MSEYKEKDLLIDTQQFLDSQYGKYIMQTLKEKMEGHLSQARNTESSHPDRYLAKYDGVAEIKELIESPLDDDISSRG